MCNEEQAFIYYTQGENFRKTGATGQNEYSSRSHSIFRLSFEIRDFNNPQKSIYSTLNMIDLAGSENIKQA